LNSICEIAGESEWNIKGYVSKSDQRTSNVERIETVPYKRECEDSHL